MVVEDLLNIMVERNASDLFISAGFPIHIKVNGALAELAPQVIAGGDAEKLASRLMNEKQQHAFQAKPEMNFALSLENGARFRVNIFRQRGEIGMVIRYLPSKIPQIDELYLPTYLHNLMDTKRGMILIVGATGSGKSTTLAAMIDHRNSNYKSHILTIEDPIEFVHPYKQSVVNQREVEMDTHSYADALKNAMREAPDVILIGEIRDSDTMQHAITYSETGHLCLSTLHASNASHALDRIVNFFQKELQQQILADMSRNLKAIISQRLVTKKDGGLVPAVEMMVVTPLISSLIAKGDLSSIHEQMEKSTEDGVQTFDQALMKLFEEEIIDKEEALKHAESASNLNVMIRLSQRKSR